MEKVILIVEDDEASFLFLDSVLKRTSAKVIHAYNGQDSLDILTRQDVTVVLMDLKMPGMDGYEATRIIKSIYKNLPVIATTAYAMYGDEQRAIKAGCDGYLTKPLKKELLLKMLEEYGITTISTNR